MGHVALDLFEGAKVSQASGNHERSRMGFAGIVSMASDVDADIARAKSKSPQATSADARIEAPAPASGEMPGAGEQAPYRLAVAFGKTAPTSNGKWLWILGSVIVGIVWLSSSSPEPNNRSESSGARYSATSSAPLVVNDTRVATSTAQLEEERPPEGRNNILTYAQLKYCGAEDIRLGAAERAMNANSAGDVERYNAMITDYNSRCGQYRYRANDRASARAAVETRRKQLEAQGAARFPSGG